MRPDHPGRRALVRACLLSLVALPLLALVGCPRQAVSPALPQPAEPEPQGPIVQVPGTDEVTGRGVENGFFRMGRPLRQGFTDEQPVHLVKVSPFRLDRTEVTNEAFAGFLSTVSKAKLGTYLKPKGNGGLASDAEGEWHAVKGKDRWPVVGVTWFGASAYCAWRGGRLPTEAEWEWAAVGPEGRVYPWGDDWDPKRCCCAENPGKPYLPVGSLPAGASWCGALDMAGNCWEWCADWYGPYPDGPQVDPKGPASGTDRVIRGGFYKNMADLFRGSCRLHQEPHVGRDGIGFRCAY
jgi:eukaryotic-like serine/threonine-protein kinase